MSADRLVVRGDAGQDEDALPMIAPTRGS